MNSPSNLRRAGAAAGALLAALCASRPALAVNCESLTAPIVYAVGASGPQPYLAAVASAVLKANGTGTLVYLPSGSCNGVTAFVSVNSAPLTQVTGSPTYYDATTGTAGATCTIANPNSGEVAQFGVSGVFPENCQGVTSLPAGVGDIHGPIQALDFLVPSQSSETSISAEAAYFTFGFGATGQYAVSPWTTPTDIITRSNTAGTAILVSLALGVPLGQVTSTSFNVQSSNGKVVSALAALNATTPQAGLGFVTAEVAEAAAANTVNVLAYQHFGQSCGWLPNATNTTHDKINVRNGLYALWAQVHFIANVDGTGTPTDPGAKQWIGYFNDTSTPPAGVDPDALAVKAGAILDCAMEVTRATDMGSLKPYTPATPCGCYFELNATGSTTCTSCTSDASCPPSATHCNKGYCEVN